MAGLHSLMSHGSALWLVLSPRVSLKTSLPRGADPQTKRDNHLPEEKAALSSWSSHLQLWASSWLVTEEETSPSSAGAGEVGTARRFAAGGRVGPPEGSAQGWWAGWAAGAACSPKLRAKAQAGEETKAPFFSLRGVGGNKGGMEQRPASGED